MLRILDDGVELVQQVDLARAPRGLRGRARRWRGRFEVRDAQGRALAAGAFRMPRDLHALFGGVDGPAEGVTVPVRARVVSFRVPTPPGATLVAVYGDRGRVRLGEVRL